MAQLFPWDRGRPDRILGAVGTTAVPGKTRHFTENPMRAIRSRACLAVALVAVAWVVAITLTPSAAQSPTPSVPQTQPQAAEPNTSVLTETIGLLGGLQLYQTYLNIGLLADVRAEGLYEAGELAQLLGSVVTPLDHVDKQLEKVAALKGLSKDDVAALARMRKIVALLRTQGKSLQALWENGGEENSKKYETARQAAWKELDDLLELDPKKGSASEPKPAEKPKP